MKGSVLFLLLTAACAARGEDAPAEKEKWEDIRIKIVDSPASRISPLQSTTDKELNLRIKPANISGPPHLQQLAGECFMLKEGGYEYKVCPFYNVTQREERFSWNNFYGVLGVWREWVIENDTLVGMHYVMGQECSLGDREAKVLFNCSTVTRLHSTSEPSTCHYVIWLDTPLACFKGAMQVYHLLTPDQLKKWEQYEYEYYAEEITFQGLTKRRRKILTHAGLLFDNEREKLRLEGEKKRREEERKRRERREKEIADNPMLKTPLTACQEERDQLRRELDEMTAKIRSVVKDYPAVAYRMGFLQNSTHTKHPGDNGVVEVTEQPREGGVAALDSDIIVSDSRHHNHNHDDEILAAVLDEDGGRGVEGERRGGKDDEMDEENVDHLNEILREINAQAEESDMLALKKELVDLHRPDHHYDEHYNAVEIEEGEKREGVEEAAVTQGDIDAEEQLLELIEEMEDAVQDPV